MNDELEPSKKSRNWWRLRLSTLLLVVAMFAVLLAWLADHQKLKSQIERTIDVNNLVGMSDATLEKKMQILGAYAWAAHNLSFDDFGRTTYFLEGGNLIVEWGENGSVSSATFVTCVDSQQERVTAVQEGWSDYVRQRSLPNRANN